MKPQPPTRQSEGRLHDAGVEHLWYAVVQQAVEDVRALQHAGLIRNGQVSDRWPASRGRHYLRVCGYDGPAQAKQLLTWWRNGSADDMLELLGAPVCAEVIMRELHI